MIYRNPRTVARAVDPVPYVIELKLPAWYEGAVCSTTDPEAFYPLKGYKGHNNIKEAKAVCGRCPVKRQCLQDAIERDEPHGIWGGMTAWERRHLHGRRVVA